MAQDPVWLTSEIMPVSDDVDASHGEPQFTEPRDGISSDVQSLLGRQGLIEPQDPIQQTSFLGSNLPDLSAEELAEFVGSPSKLKLDVTPSRALLRIPDMMGTILRLGPQQDVTFRPAATIPGPSNGTVVLDAANNRFVYVDSGNETLVPGAPNLGADLVTFIAPGGGSLVGTADTLPDGTRGFFGLTRVTQDATSGTTTQSLPGFDLLSQTPPGAMSITSIGVTNPVSMVGYTAEPHTAHLSVVTPSPTNPSLTPFGVNRQADGGNVMPRNRVFFHHSSFNSVALGPGIDVHRFTPGFETTLAHGLMSLEARFPFASTQDVTDVINGSTSTSEVDFGNVSLHVKSVFAGGEDWVLSGGLQVTLPTGDDSSLAITDRGRTVEFLRLDNDTVHLMPFVGLATAPNDRLYMQTIVQVDVDTRGRDVLFNANALNGGSLSSIGRLNDATLLYVDFHVGYWLISDTESSMRTITGVAPVFELHTATSLSESDRVDFTPIGTLGSRRDYNLVTATYGCVFEFWHNTLLQVGYSTPLEGGLDEDFDGELRAMVSRRFGSR
ncbi:MAG: hypothetical protein ACYTGL_26565 [Planctomycetota bacterium]|jgi:hypothetical protein